MSAYDFHSDPMFVGRKNELEQFEQYIYRPTSGDLSDISHNAIKARVFLPHGIGGIGKTELTKRCLSISTRAGWQAIYVDLDLIANHPIEFMDILNVIIEKLEILDGGKQAVQSFHDLRKQLLEIRERVENFRIVNTEVWQQIVENSYSVSSQLTTPEAQAIGFAATAALDYGPRLLNLLVDKMVAKKKLSIAEALLFSKSDEQMARQLVKVFQSIAKQTGLVVAIDTCEAITIAVEEALRDILICPAVENSTGLIFILSGRNSQHHAREVDGHYVSGYADRLPDPPPVSWDLTQFSAVEIKDYLKFWALPRTVDIVTYLQQTTRGVPFAVYLLANALDKLGFEYVKKNIPPDDGEVDLTEILRLVVNRFLRYCLDNPVDKFRIFTLAVLRIRDDAALRVIWQLSNVESPRSVLNALRTRYGFIQSDYTLNEIVIEYLRSLLRADDRETAKLIGAITTKYYLPYYQTESSIFPSIKDRLTEQRWRSITFEVLNALAWSDEQEALRFLVNQVLEVQIIEPNLAKSILKLLQEFRDTSDWWHSRSNRLFDLLIQTGSSNPSEALTALDAMLHEYRHSLTSENIALTNLQRALCLVRQGRWEMALNACREVEKSMPEDSSILSILAEAYRQVGVNINNQFPRNPLLSQEVLFAITRASELDPKFLSCRGCIYTSQGNFSGALAVFDRAIELEPENEGNYWLRGRTYNEFQDYSAALKDFNKAIELNPDDASSYHDRGHTRQSLNDHEAAIADYTHAIDIEPTESRNYKCRGVAYLVIENYPAALADLSKAIELNPDGGDNYHQRAHVWEAKKDYDKAIDDFTKAINLDPYGARHYMCRGIFYVELGNYSEAITDFNKVLDLEPADDDAVRCLILCHYNLKEYSKALSEITKIIDKLPETEQNDLSYLSACCYGNLLQLDEVIIWLRRAISSDIQFLEKSREDSCFDPFRNRPAFISLLNEFALAT